MSVSEKTGSEPAADGDTAAGGVVPGEMLDELLAKVRSEGVDLLGEEGVVAQLTKQLLERALGACQDVCVSDGP
jgi:hypothetical protein